MRVASSLLRDRVFEEVRVKRNLSYAPDAFLRNQSANIGGLYVTAVDANQAVRVMLNEIARLQREPIGRDDINAVIAQFLTTYYIGQETNAAQAAELAQYELIGGGWRNSLVFLEKLRASPPRTCNASRKSTCATFASSCWATRRRSIRMCLSGKREIDDVYLPSRCQRPVAEYSKFPISASISNSLSVARKVGNRPTVFFAIPDSSICSSHILVGLQECTCSSARLPCIRRRFPAES